MLNSAKFYYFDNDLRHILRMKTKIVCFLLPKYVTFFPNFHTFYSLKRKLSADERRNRTISLLIESIDAKFTQISLFW